MAILVATTSDQGGEEAELGRVAAVLAPANHAETLAAWAARRAMRRRASGRFGCDRRFAPREPLVRDAPCPPRDDQGREGAAGALPPEHGARLLSLARRLPHELQLPAAVLGRLRREPHRGGGCLLDRHGVLLSDGEDHRREVLRTRGASFSSRISDSGTDDVLGAVPMGPHGLHERAGPQASTGRDTSSRSMRTG